MQMSMTQFKLKKLLKGEEKENMEMTMQNPSLEAVNEHKSVGFVKRTFQKLNGNEKGLTLIELLAVIVILGIIAAIAIPSVNAVIRNSERSAQKANAHQIVDAAKLNVSSTSFDSLTTLTTPSSLPANIPTTGTVVNAFRTLTLQQLIDNGFLKPIEDPYHKGTQYHLTSTLVTIARHSVTDTNGNVSDSFFYYITLIGASTTTPYYSLTPEEEINNASGTGVNINLN